MITIAARRSDAGLLAMAGFLAIAYFLAPALLGPSRVEDFPDAFILYWTSGGPDFPPELQPIVDHQFRYHLLRLTITLLLLGVLLALAARLPRRRLPLGALALVAAVLLIANVQGAASPFGTLLPNLASDPRMPAVLDEIREQLTNGPASPALDVMLGEYTRWHVLKALLIGLLSIVLIGLSVTAWPRRRWASLLTAAVAVAALVVVAANVSTVASPDAPFLMLIDGG
ncbi:hypothetical protein Kisp01_19670 [Kineosporia sp. NBRC 101677]|uniref:hypothetical protein n=1 Tax=Kineosporia sp. NBRC 101677 TaxID=3032197 RepID=UPI0024A4CE8A|nr:hypothetical protein [Kineosporia sp. NBRC 101677]GLY14952.1 hypothetical protein Kisp01_19670 [Kineosporia sp. NBRC 101677]